MTRRRVQTAVSGAARGVSVGFTGTTSRALTAPEVEWLEDSIRQLSPEDAHHGDGPGGDVAFHGAVRKLAPQCTVHVHPAGPSRVRAFCPADVVHPLTPRSGHRLAAVSVLLVVPGSNAELRNSGSWAVVRHARSSGADVRVYPGTPRSVRL